MKLYLGLITTNKNLKKKANKVVHNPEKLAAMLTLKLGSLQT
jgi:hypothetical protein